MVRNVSGSDAISATIAGLSLNQPAVQQSAPPPLPENMFKSAMNDPAFNDYLKDIHSVDFSEIAAQDIQFSEILSPSALGTIKETLPGLMTGTLKTLENKTVFFGREELKTEDDQDRWKNFLEIEFLDLNALGFLSILMGKKPNNVEQGFKAKEDFKNLDLNFIKTMSYLKETVKLINPKPGVNPYKEQATNIFNAFCALHGFKPFAKKGEKSFALYVSNKPIENYAFTNLPDSRSPHHLADTITLTSHISMCVGNKVRDNVSVHRGISKLPLPLLSKIKADFKDEKTQAVIPLSAALHFFGMRCQQAEKVGYFTVAPFGAMSHIFRKVLIQTDQEKHFAFGLEEIKKKGQLSLMREVTKQPNGEVEDVCVGHLSKIIVPLWT